MASNVIDGPGDVIPNAVPANVGEGGKVSIYTLAWSDIIADVNGYVNERAGHSPRESRSVMSDAR